VIRSSLLLLAALGAACSSQPAPIRTCDGDCSSATPHTVPAGGACGADADCAAENAVCTTAGNGTRVCTAALTGDCYMTECDGTANTANCAGFTCVTLQSNVQKKKGMCSLVCSTDATCGPRGICVSAGAGNVCMTPCTTDADCHNGFVCVAPDTSGRKACLVDVGDAG